MIVVDGMRAAIGELQCALDITCLVGQANLGGRGPDHEPVADLEQRCTRVRPQLTDRVRPQLDDRVLAPSGEDREASTAHPVHRSACAYRVSKLAGEP